ncbi:FAD binding domain-containing protein [Desulfosporosinus youngiae]|uniref:Aerobic-type carbon monoxide dehydrogenase, middle subunit CoxM/CutM-like protein n=1 Tax=Desulfosporosinus youngiae DSM 17734 TaxID=768710 RepID=H5Y1H2_9FIRM|nr:FAD binding domain-containing protein [Desulfosporosinus youngiae]EHQ87585.1 aerobic-type carbon monoxide dehydrogenase, middle subunit CoxM/CutM-like protein [Desulfosporosinus youngiae DSM 17734]
MPECSVYYQPESISDAVKYLASADKRLKPLAGGTDIVPAMRKGEMNVDGLVDLSKIPGLREINIDDNELKLGSLCTFAQIEKSLLIQTQVPLLAQAAGAVGSPQIRSLGTIGGNIANASPAADTVTAFVALDAKARLESTRGTRSVPVSELLCGVGKTNISRDEIIAEIRFQIPSENSQSGFIKLGRRKALAIARMNLAIIITEHDGLIDFARVSLGAVGPNPSRNTSLEEFLIGQKPSESLIDSFARFAGEEVSRMLGSRASAAYKCEAVKGIVRDLSSRLFLGNEQVVI